MGDRDSTWTRVAPVFDELLARDRTGQAWLDQLISMPTFPGTSRPTRVLRGPLRAWAWGTAEKQLMPPVVLLQWLVACGRPRPGRPLGASPVTITKRTSLVQRDPAVIGEALALLNQPSVPSRAWYVLEGPSQPDVYLETDDAIIVIEGKRTESGPTRTTDWMEPRDQMLRHLDCAHACRGGKIVLGFLIVEGEGGATATSVPQAWADAAAETLAPPILTASLPHRLQGERTAIAESFLGVTTWQAVCAKLGVDYSALPDTYAPPIA